MKKIAIISILILVVFSALTIPVRAETFKVTFYCNCKACCSKPPTHPAYGITASGKKARPGTIAVDRKLIPLGSRVWIEGIGECRAEDVGGAIKGKHIDVWCGSHKEALQKGVQYLDVKLLPNLTYQKRDGK